MRVTSTDMQGDFGRDLKFSEANEDIIVTRNGKDAAKLSAFGNGDENHP